ncbi:unnamed protein product [Paramecium sonneborni]|uniref:Cyclic nucleotide-binding domain-containing protein n=1 Tax=Paramecium sonneborni TaxID=65129 RepID=A0A8S1NYX6_9CILI|nr:unnamed protein product [Paramecium sonneborni]
MTSFSNFDEKASLINLCVKTLQIAPSRRTQSDLTHLLQLVEAITFFKNLQSQNPDIVMRCMSVLSYKTVKKEEILFHVGDSGSLFYIILKGSVGVFILLPSPDDFNRFELKEVNVLKAGNSFGELALLNDNAKRTATIIAKEDCMLAVMEKHHFKAILGAQEQQKVQDRISFLCSFPFLQSWSFREIKTISYHFEPIQVTLNQAVIKQNDYCSNFYIVREGNFEVTYTLNDSHRLKGISSTHSICVLGPGEFFGEEAFLMDDGKTFILKLFNIFTIRWQKVKCSIICRSQCGQILRISREDIIKRFWDEKTQSVFLSLLQSIHQFRLNKMRYYEEMADDKLKQINGQEGIDQFVKPMLKVKVRNNCTLMRREPQQEKSDMEYQFYKKQEKKAFEQFKKLFKDRNCSYAQVKTFFDQKTIGSQNYIDRDSYFKLFFRFPSQLKNSEISQSLSQQQPSTARTQYRLTTQTKEEQEKSAHFSTKQRTQQILSKLKFHEVLPKSKTIHYSNSPLSIQRLELRRFGTQSYLQMK